MAKINQGNFLAISSIWPAIVSSIGSYFCFHYLSFTHTYMHKLIPFHFILSLSSRTPSKNPSLLLFFLHGRIHESSNKNCWLTSNLLYSSFNLSQNMCAIILLHKVSPFEWFSLILQPTHTKYTKNTPSYKPLLYLS